MEEETPILPWSETISLPECQTTGFKYVKNTYDSSRKNTSSESSLE